MRIIASLFLALPTLTFVAACGPAAAKGFYVSTSFGPNWDEGEPFAFVNEDTGLAGMVALGTHVDGVDGLRFELEASFRTHEGTFGPISFEHDTTALMANAVYDFSGLDKFVPYVLLGAGAAWTDFTVANFAPLSLENSGFAWQAGVGVNYRVTDSVSLGVGYRYLDAPAVELNGGTIELDGGGNHAVLATATVALN
jgi:opacity protein-like surface antigen